MSEALISKAAAGVSYFAAGVARAAKRRHQRDGRRHQKTSRQQRPTPDLPVFDTDRLCTAEQARWRNTLQRIFSLKEIILDCKRDREARSPVNELSTSQRRRRMRNRLRSRIEKTEELLQSFRDDLDAQPPLSETRSQNLCFHVSEAEKVIAHMRLRLQALSAQASFHRDPVVAVKVEMPGA